MSNELILFKCDVGVCVTGSTNRQKFALILIVKCIVCTRTTVFLKRSAGNARTLNMNQLMVRVVGNFAPVDGYRLFWDKWQGGCGLLHLFSALIDGFRAFGACKWVALGRETAMEALSCIVLKTAIGRSTSLGVCNLFFNYLYSCLNITYQHTTNL